MTTQPSSDVETLTDSFIEDVCGRFAEGRRVRRRLPRGGLLTLDRRLPFLCVYREPTDWNDPGTRELVSGEAAVLIAPCGPEQDAWLRRLVEGLSEAAVARFGEFLILEVWAAPDEATPQRYDPETGEALLPQPWFRIQGLSPGPAEPVTSRLYSELQRIRVFRQGAEVVLSPHAHPHPPELPPLMTTAAGKERRCRLLGLEVRPVYRDPATKCVYPAALRALRRGMGRALKQTFFAFASAHTNLSPRHYSALGRRTMSRTVWDVDRQLAEVSESFDFLLQVTPINSETAWHEFKRGGFRSAPMFDYRPLADEPMLLKRRLFQVPVERIEDATLAHIFREKQDELDRKITMLSDVGTPRFLHGSLQVYGGVDGALLNLANEMLRRIPLRDDDDDVGLPLDAAEFADRALAEMDFYRAAWPEFSAGVVVRDDMYSGLMVSRGDLLIGRETVIPAPRVEALVQHEIGTHCLTYHNARAQPLRQLRSGLAGYEALQEGLAVLAEYFAGGLSRPRLRLLAARVVAVHHLVRGAPFPETYRLLHETFGLPARVAFTVTVRVYRGGGLTKDAIYLRGLVDVLGHLSRGGSLDTLMVGKMALEHVSLVEELLHREVLRAPPLRPRYMDNPRTPDKLARLAQGLSVLDLVEGQTA